MIGRYFGQVGFLTLHLRLTFPHPRGRLLCSNLKHHHTKGKDVSFLCEVGAFHQCLWRHIQNSTWLSTGEVLCTGGTVLGLTEVAYLSSGAIFVNQHVLCRQVAMKDLGIVLVEVL